MKFVKFVSIKVEYDTEETWDITLEEVQEIFHMMNTQIRKITFVKKFIAIILIPFT